MGDLLSIRASAMLMVVATAIAPRHAQATEPRPVGELTYTAAPDGLGCVDEPVFRGRVAVRLGYDPFVPSSRLRVNVRFALEGKKLVGEVAFFMGDSASGKRRLVESAGRCDVLTDALAGAVAIAIDPVGKVAVREDRASVAPVEASPPPVTTPPVVAREAVTPVESTPSPRIVAFVTLDGVASLGVAPGPTLGGQAGAGLRRRNLALGLEARVETVAESVVLSPRDRVTASVYSGAVQPCGYISVVAICAGARVGALQGTALDVSRPALKASLFAAGYVRVGLRIPLGQSFAVRAAVEGGIPFLRTAFVVDDVPIWTAPVVHASSLLGVEWKSM